MEPGLCPTKSATLCGGATVGMMLRLMAPDREGGRWGLITGIAALTDHSASRFIQLDTEM